MACIDILSDSTGKEIVAAIQSTDVAQARISEINAAAELKKNEVLGSIPEDYSNIVNDVNQLKSDLSELNEEIDKRITTVYGLNYYTGLNETNGYISKNDGSITPNYGDWVTTDFISVRDAENLILSGINTYNTRVLLDFYFLLGFDENKNPIAETYTTTHGGYYTIPTNVKYIRFSYHSFFGGLMLEEGTAMSGNYEPYKETYIFNGEVGIKPYENIKWVCVGDSLTEVNSRTTKHYYDYVAEKTGINVVNMGVSGTGYAKRADINQAFYQRISNVPTDADVVTIFGSGNDLSAGLELGTPTDTGTTTICGCINTTIDNLYAVLPTVQLGIVTPTPWIGNEPSNNGEMARYSEAIVEICKLRGIPCLDLFHCSGLRPNDANYRSLVYSKDDGNGVHPNELGHKIISGHFYTLLQSLIGTY